MSRLSSPFAAILLGAVIIAAGVVVTGGLMSSVTAAPNSMGSGQYQLMNHSNQTAVAGVFRIDTSSGEVSYCYVNESGGGVSVICSKSVQ